MKSHKEIILNLEKELLKPEVRKSNERLREVLSEDFIEYCSSGQLYHYNPNDIFFEENVSFRIIDFNITILSDECVLATYKIDRIYNKDNIINSSLRSSIWKLYNSQWKMIFHQGTLIK